MKESLKKICESNKFNILSVEYVVAEDTTYFTIVKCDESADLQGFEKEVKQLLNLETKLVFRVREFAKDGDKIAKILHKILSSNPLTTVSNSDISYINITIEGENAEIRLKCTNVVRESIEKGEKERIIKLLKQDFLNNFSFSYEILNEEIKEINLDTRKQKLDYVGEQVVTDNSYEVKDISPIFGDRLINKVRPIDSIKSPMENVYLAGRINYLKKSTYNRKYSKDGKEFEMEKTRFNFELVDHTGKISAVIFPNKANLQKCDLLESGKDVVVLCSVEEYAGKLSMSVKEIGFCVIDDEGKRRKNYKSEFKEYIKVFPNPYIDYTQVDMFAKAKPLPRTLEGKSFVVFDTETTGVNADKDKIIEIGAVKIVNGIITETFETMVNPKMHIPEEASSVNNITDDMVCDAPTIDEVLPDFYKFTRGCALVAHNIDFDIRFIRNAGEECGYLFDNELYDTLAISRKHLRLSNHKLQTICEFLGISLVGAHRALNDTVATAQVFIKLCEFMD